MLNGMVSCRWEGVEAKSSQHEPRLEGVTVIARNSVEEPKKSDTKGEREGPV